MKIERFCKRGFHSLLTIFIFSFLLLSTVTLSAASQETFAGIVTNDLQIASAAPTQQKTPNVKADSASSAGTAKKYTEESVSTLYEGKGVGKKTLSEVCKENGLDINLIKKKLAKQNLQMKEDEPLLNAAQRVSKSPIDVMKMILVGEPVKK